ncbi:MAG: response regulator [Lachnospiraceae bacterium]|nr:response regulator [Lachnospiraceae bacterium]
MTKVFLVEDEYVVREGIKNKIAWAENGFDFCGEAADGELALPLIEKLRPEIVITDIKMPFMDGLEMSKIIRKEFPETEIVFLTGYAEFEYAKEAIKLGVAEYLTKPISGNDLMKVLKNIQKRIEEKQQEKDIRQYYLKEMAENTEKDKKRLFVDLVSGGKHTADLILNARELGIEISASAYSILMLRIKSAYHEQNEFSKSVIKLFDEIEELCADGNPIVFDRSPEGKVYIFKGEDEISLQADIEKFISLIKEKLDMHKHIQYFGGIGETVKRLGELNTCFESASHAFAHRYLVDENMFMWSKDVKRSTILKENDTDIVVPKQLDRTKFIEFLKLGDKDDAKYFVEEFLSGIGSNAIKSLLMRQYVVVDAYLKVSEFLSTIGSNDIKLEQVNERKDTLTSEKGAEEYLIRLIETAISTREAASRSRYSELVSEITEFINENYKNDELSLNMVAQYMNFSPNHLSMIFSQETGRTFIKYLTDLRMNKAKELLKCTSKRSSEICEEVGYKDPHYFSYLFKKNVGMTPTEYRG